MQVPQPCCLQPYFWSTQWHPGSYYIVWLWSRCCSWGGFCQRVCHTLLSTSVSILTWVFVASCLFLKALCSCPLASGLHPLGAWQIYGEQRTLEVEGKKSYPCPPATSPESAKLPSTCGSWHYENLAKNEIKIPLLGRKLIRAECSRQGLLVQKWDSLFCHWLVFYCHVNEIKCTVTDGGLRRKETSERDEQVL